MKTKALSEYVSDGTQLSHQVLPQQNREESMESSIIERQQ